MKITVSLLTLCAAITLSGCDDASVARHNLSKAGDNFELNRRIIFVNTWTDKQLLLIEGRCNVDYGNSHTSVICKVGEKRV